MKPQTHLTAMETARRLGVGLQYVYSLCWSGKLTGAKKDNGRWLIPADTVTDRINSQNEEGRQ